MRPSEMARMETRDGITDFLKVLRPKLAPMHIHHVAMTLLPSSHESVSMGNVSEVSHADKSAMLTWKGLKPAPNIDRTIWSTRNNRNHVFPERFVRFAALLFRSAWAGPPMPGVGR